MRSELGPQDIAAVTIAENPSEAGATPPVRLRLDFFQQRIGEVLVLGREIIGHPIAVQHEIPRVTPQIRDAELHPMSEPAGAADAVDSAEKPPHPFTVGGSPQL